MLCLLRNITYSFCTLDYSLIFYLTLIITKLEYVSALWEFDNVYWRQRAGAHSTEDRSLVSISFLYSWPRQLQRFVGNFPSSYTAQQVNLSYRFISHLCIFRFEMLPASFGWYCQPSSFSDGSINYRHQWRGETWTWVRIVSSGGLFWKR